MPSLPSGSSFLVNFPHYPHPVVAAALLCGASPLRMTLASATEPLHHSRRRTTLSLSARHIPLPWPSLLLPLPAIQPSSVSDQAVSTMAD